MLVLSRGLQDKVVFPNLGIEVEILRIAGDRVKLGIQAPKEIRVLRHELSEAATAFDAPPLEDAQPLKNDYLAAHEERHALRNELNTACLMLGLAEKQLNRGMSDEALVTLGAAIRQFAKTDRDQAPEFETTPAEPAAPRALVVDDDTNESELLAGYLRLSGFEVDTAADGLQAIVQLNRQHRPDVVLMDMNMPGMNGAKTVESIRGNDDFNGISIFAVTGEDAGAYGVPIGDRGVDRWFTKPIKPDVLVSEMTKQLARL